jgi:hypothetical protein
VHPNIQTNVFNKKKKKKKKKETVNESLNAGFTLHASGRNTLRWPESGQLKYDEAMTKSRDWRGIRFQNPRGEARQNLSSDLKIEWLNGFNISKSC